MPVVLKDLSQLPTGAHALAFHASADEAVEHAGDFLEGAPDVSSASYWVADEEARSKYRERIARRSPELAERVMVLPSLQVRLEGRVLRPVPTIREWVETHPGGVSGGAETFARYWNPEDIPRYEEYESWFHRQDRERSRFLCPYDLRVIPIDLAPSLMRSLSESHDHLTLSCTEDPLGGLLQLFLFSSPRGVPEQLRSTFDYAVEYGWVQHDPSSGFSWTVRGEHFAHVLREGAQFRGRP